MDSATESVGESDLEAGLEAEYDLESGYYYMSNTSPIPDNMRDPIFRENNQALKDLSIVTDGYISNYILDREERSEMKLPQWTVHDLKVLIAAKRLEFEMDMTTNGRGQNAKGKVDSRGQMIADFLKGKGVTDPIRDEKSCREMWEILSMDWWDLHDSDRMRPSGSKSYYEMSPSERRQWSPFPIPEEFPRELHDDLLAWLPKLEERQKSANMVDTSKLNREFERSLKRSSTTS